MESIYTSPVITVKPDDSIFETLRKMQLNFIKRIVVAEKNKPIGIVTERDINRFLESDKTSKALDEIPIKHVMNRNVITVVDGIDDHFNQCATRMDTFRIGSVVLVDDSGELIGIVTKTDITKAYSMVYGGKYIVKDYMSRKVVTCRKNDTVKYALNLMNQNDISRLIVTNESGNPVGIISTNTFLTHSDYFSNGKTRSRDYLLPIDDNKDVKVSELLSEDLLTIDANDDLATAANLMIKNKVSGIPVISKNKELIGVITKFDIVRAFTVVGSHQELKSKYREFY
jgi:CBS domain-containing protein